MDDQLSVHDLIIADIHERRRNGTGLPTPYGSSNLEEAYSQLLDAVIHLRGEIESRDAAEQPWRCASQHIVAPTLLEAIVRCVFTLSNHHSDVHRGYHPSRGVITWPVES